MPTQKNDLQKKLETENDMLKKYYVFLNTKFLELAMKVDKMDKNKETEPPSYFIKRVK